jgi:hypothetical protein
MIRSYIKKHDQMSFEAKLEFPAKGKSGKENDDNFDIYLFLPSGLDINKHNFTNRDFYNSLKTNIRLTTPLYLLRNIVGGEKSPFNRLTNSIETFLSSPSPETEAEYKLQVKRFCSVFGVALRHEVNHIISTKNAEDRDQLIKKFAKNVKKVRENYKSLRNNINVPLPDSRVFAVYQSADEYQSLLVEKHIFTLISRLNLEQTGDGLSGESLNKMVLDEMNYRMEKGYPSVAKPNRPNEDILHRSGRLKKFIESNLFLNTDTKKEGVLVEQILFSIAAGIAMVFATGVAFASQMFYGNLSLPFFIALVISYMFKDRIKELIRVYLDKKHQKMFYDYKTNIYPQNKKKIGYLKESFHFEQYMHLPKEIIDVRNSMRSTEITEESLGEKIIHYRTKVSIMNTKETVEDFTGITQILRLNISDFTRKMDDPEKEVFIRTKKGFKRAFADRVYHINMILTYSDNDDVEIKPFKLIANRKGIKRIEKINLSGDD